MNLLENAEKLLNHIRTKASFVHQVCLTKKEENVLCKIFLQGKMLTDCETVCLWSFNFPLSRETQFKEAPV